MWWHLPKPLFTLLWCELIKGLSLLLSKKCFMVIIKVVCIFMFFVTKGLVMVNTILLLCRFARGIYHTESKEQSNKWTQLHPGYVVPCLIQEKTWLKITHVCECGTTCILHLRLLYSAFAMTLRFKELRFFINQHHVKRMGSLFCGYLNYVSLNQPSSTRSSEIRVGHTYSMSSKTHQYEIYPHYFVNAPYYTVSQTPTSKHLLCQVPMPLH